MVMMLVVIVVDITIYDLKYYCYKTNKQTNKPRKYRKKIKIKIKLKGEKENKK